MNPICPKCGSQDTAYILWGYVPNVNDLKHDLDNKKVVLGGCLVSDHDPYRECNDCFHRWEKNDEGENK